MSVFSPSDSSDLREVSFKYINEPLFMITSDGDDSGVWGVGADSGDELVEVVNSLLSRSNKFTSLSEGAESGEIDHVSDESDGIGLELSDGAMKQRNGVWVSVGSL